jgi:secreted Zn-dependent insulinase-like peptidase
VSDFARIDQLYSEHTAANNHLLNRFAWGNLKSLMAEEPETLWEDLKAFYETHYSADRLKIAIQVKTQDDLAELRTWVTEYFSVI